MVDVEIKRGYEVLSDNNVRFGIRVINNSGSAIMDTEVILDYSEDSFKLHGDKIQKLGVIPPSVPRTAKFLLQPKGCIHKEELGATVLYKDHGWNKQVGQMRPKEVHCVCPFLKEKSISRAEFLALLKSGYSADSGVNFENIGSSNVVEFLTHTCKNRLYKVDEFSVEGGTIIYLAGDAVGEKAYYLLTAVVKEHEGLTQVFLRGNSDKDHGLTGFLNETLDNLRHLVLTGRVREIGIIKREQVINIIDSVVQRTTFGGGEGTASVNIEGSVVQRTEFNADVGGGAEKERLRVEQEIKQKVEISRREGEEKERKVREELEEAKRLADLRKEKDEKKEELRRQEESEKERRALDGVELIGGFKRTWKNVMKNPRRFIEQMPTEGGYSDPVKFAAISYLVAGIGLTLITAGVGFPLIIIMPIMGIIGIFIGGLFLHIFFKVVGGKGTYEGTVRLLAYASATMALSWIPLVGILANLYMIYMEVMGGTKIHKISTLSSLIAVLVLPLRLVIVFVVVLGTAIDGIISSMGGMY